MSPSSASNHSPSATNRPALPAAQLAVGAHGRGEPGGADGAVLLQLDIRARVVEGRVRQRGDADVDVRHRPQELAEGHLGAKLVALTPQRQAHPDGYYAQLRVPVEQPAEHIHDRQQPQVALVLCARHPAHRDAGVGGLHAEALQVAVEVVPDHRHVVGARRAVLLRQHPAGRRRQVGRAREPQDFGKALGVGRPRLPARFERARGAGGHVGDAEVVVVVEAHRHALLDKLLQIARAVHAAKAVHEIASEQLPERQIPLQMRGPQHVVPEPLQRAHREDHPVVGVGGPRLGDEAQSHRRA